MSRLYRVIVEFETMYELSHDELYEVSRWAPDCIEQVYNAKLSHCDVYEVNDEETENAR